MDKFKARKDKVLMTTKVDQTTASGLIIPDEAKSKNIAKVVSVPEGIDDLKPGDKVVFNPFTANQLVIDGKEFIVVKDESIYGILNQ